MDEEIELIKAELVNLEKENEILRQKLIELQGNAIKKGISKIMIVEGNHERNFFEAWLEAINLVDIQVLSIGGKDRFKGDFPVLVRSPNFVNIVSILIVRDADDDPKSAFESVCSVLRSPRVISSLSNKGIVLKIPESQWIFTQGTIPKVGIAILPARDQTGALEELLLQTIDNDPMSKKSHDFIDDTIVTLSNPDYRNPPPSHRVGKAKIHAFLSTFEEPDKDQGKAALASVWNFEHRALESLCKILKEL